MYRKLLVPLGIIVIVLVSLGLSGGTGSAACLTDTGATPCGGFNPAWGPTGTTAVGFSTTALSGHPNITTSLDINAPSYNFAESVTLGDNSVTTSTTPAIGSYMGNLQSNALLGLSNSGCFNGFPITFNLVSAAPNNTSPAGEIGDNGPGSATLANWAEDDGDFDNSHQTTLTAGSAAGAGPTVLAVAAAANIGPVAGPYGEVISVGGATSPDVSNLTVTSMTATSITVSGAIKAHNSGDTVDIVDAGMNAYAFNGVSDGADAYPTGLKNAFNGIFPVARYMGVAFVANSLIVPLNLLVFAPGALSALPNHAWMTAAWGTPSSAILNDPDAAPSNSAISDFCNFSSQTLLNGVAHDNLCTPVPGPAGCTASGSGFTLRLAADGGTTGSTTPNEATNCSGGPPCVRATNPSSAACAALPNGNSSGCTVKWRQYAMSYRDADNDGIDNSFDPCPFNADTVWDPYSVAPSGDSNGNGIPDTCDASGSSSQDVDSDGVLNRGDICPQVADGAYTTTPNHNQFDQDVAPAVSVPDGGPHSDSIGPACDPNPTANNGRYASTVIAQTICIGGGGAKATDCSTSLDSDGDGVKNAFDNCIGGANTPIAGPPAYAQSQRDLNADGSADILDSALLAGAFGKVGGVPTAPAGYEGRLDLNYDNVIDILDISLEAGVFNHTC